MDEQDGRFDVCPVLFSTTCKDGDRPAMSMPLRRISTPAHQATLPWLQICFKPRKPLWRGAFLDCGGETLRPDETFGIRFCHGGSRAERESCTCISEPC